MQQHIIDYDKARRKFARERHMVGMRLEREAPPKFAVNIRGNPEKTKSFQATLSSYIGAYQASQVEKGLREKLSVQLYAVVISFYADAIGEDLKDMSPNLYPKYVDELVKLLKYDAAVEAKAAEIINEQNQELIRIASQARIGRESQLFQGIENGSESSSDYTNSIVDGIRVGSDGSYSEPSAPYVNQRASSLPDPSMMALRPQIPLARTQSLNGFGMISQKTMRKAQRAAGNDSRRYC